MSFLKTKNMSETKNLKNFYRGLEAKTPPKTAFIRRVAERCGVSLHTVRFWVWGKTKPHDASSYEVLSEETGIPIDKLFED